MQIGVIGLGAMGRQIAAKLVGAGHEVTVWNRSPEPVDALVAAGARRAAAPADAMRGDVALSILFDDTAIRATLLEGGALDHAEPSCIHVCMSTISMDLALELEARHAARGMRYVAAPLLGRPDVIARGALTILAAGESASIDALEAPFATLGTAWRLGTQPAHANIAKLAANFMIAGAIEAMAEAAALTGAFGADPETFLTTMTATLFAAPIYTMYAAMIAGHAPAQPSGLALPLKDIGNTLRAADAKKLNLPLAKTIKAHLTQATSAGRGDHDWSTALAAVARETISPT